MFTLQMMLSPWALVNIEMLISPLARTFGQDNVLDTRATKCASVVSFKQFHHGSGKLRKQPTNICHSLNLICYDSSMFNSWLIHIHTQTNIFRPSLIFLLVMLDINAMLTLGQYLQSFVNVLVLMSMYVIHCLMRIL